MCSGTLKERMFEFISTRPDGILSSEVFVEFLAEVDCNAQIDIICELYKEGRIENFVGPHQDKIRAIKPIESKTERSSIFQMVNYGIFKARALIRNWGKKLNNYFRTDKKPPLQK